MLHHEERKDLTHTERFVAWRRGQLSNFSTMGDKSTQIFSGLDESCVVVLGAQWGDEGKGKLVDILAQKAKICARFNGGANAGHTLVVEGKKYAFHLLPCGMINKDCTNLIGNGVVMHIPTMMKELKALEEFDPHALKRLMISTRTSLLFDCHQIVDGLLEAEKDSKAIGTTKRGIGPCYSTKTIRNGLRAGDLLHFDGPEGFETKLRELVTWFQARYEFEYDIESEVKLYREYSKLLKDQIVDTTMLLKRSFDKNEPVLIEGANAALLDIDFGTYPYVTSSNTTIGGVFTGLGIPPSRLSGVIGVVKAYCTRVGAGPFPTELFDSVGDHLGDVGHEFGTTTGRARRCGWIDVPMLQYSHALNGYTSLNLTKLDVLTGLDEVKICSRYIDSRTGSYLPVGYFPDHLEDLAAVKVEYVVMPGWKEDISKCRDFADLPAAAKDYVTKLEELIGVKFSWIGVGPDREDMFLHHA